MTVVFPEKNIFDKVLFMLGKKRAVYMPNDNQNCSDYKRARKESFFRALFRKKGGKPPAGWTYISIDDLLDKNK